MSTINEVPGVVCGAAHPTVAGVTCVGYRDHVARFQDHVGGGHAWPVDLGPGRVERVDEDVFGDPLVLPREVRVMTDYQLANELVGTMGRLRAVLPPEYDRDLDRIILAVRFLRGERLNSGLTDEELHQLLENDPVVNAIFTAARVQARKDLAREARRESAAAEMATIGATPVEVPESGELPEGLIAVPNLCDSCLHSLIHKFLIAKESDPWNAWKVLVQMLLLQVVHEDEDAEKLGGAQDLQGILLAIGCLGCRYPRALREAGLMVRHRGADFVGRVIKGEAKAINWEPKSFARRRV